MKKLAFMFVAIVTISFASCGNITQGPAVDSDTIPDINDSLIDSLANVSDSIAAMDSTANAI